jgi:Sugar-specific transcriptional regulator TrmB.
LSRHSTLLREATSAEIAERVGYDRDTAYRRLRLLAEVERVERHEVGTSLLWSAPEDT